MLNSLGVDLISILIAVANADTFKYGNLRSFAMEELMKMTVDTRSRKFVSGRSARHKNKS